jgi:tRNA threonylcarbamoyladenosine biosynthesis protein TsaE
MKRNESLFDAARARTCKDERELNAVAAELAAALRPGDAVALSGPLGAGKTTFARALVRTLHGRDEGTSPTFTFRHRYEGVPPVEHLDLYRIESAREAAELGLEEAFQADAITLVEWWKNAPHLLPARRWEVAIDGSGDAPRTVTIAPPQP